MGSTAAARLLKYETCRGSPELRHEIARRMALHGTVVSPDDIIITNGCQEALAEQISIAPGVIFSPTATEGSNSYSNFIRLNCAAAPDARLERPCKP